MGWWNNQPRDANGRWTSTSGGGTFTHNPPSWTKSSWDRFEGSRGTYEMRQPSHLGFIGGIAVGTAAGVLGGWKVAGPVGLGTSIVLNRVRKVD